MLFRYESRIKVSALALLFVLSTSPVMAQGGVVARVNGVDITAEDYAVAEQIYGQQLGDMPADAKRSMIVDALIESRLMAEAARKAGIADDAEYKRQMAFFEAQTLRSIYVQREIAKRVDDATVRKAYDDEVAKAPVVEEVRIRHMLFATTEEAAAAIAELKAGADFAALSKAKSLDPASKEKGGDLGFVTPGQTLAEIDSAASKLSPGQFTETPAKSAFGYHVVKVDERRPRPAPPFESLAGEIRQALQAEAARTIADELQAAAKVEKLVPDVQPPAGDDGHNH